MKENKFNFESESLTVDYLEFKFNVLPEFIKQKIVQFFFISSQNKKRLT